MPGLERDANLAIGLEAANARAMPCARVDNDEGAESQIEFDALRRNDARERIIHRPIELPTVQYELDIIVKHVRGSFLLMLAILLAALVHYVPEQDATLSRIDDVLDRRGD